MFESTPPTLADVAGMLDAIGIDAYQHMSPREQIAACEALGRLESRVKAHQLAAAAAADRSEAASTIGATSTGAMIANGFGGDPGAAAKLLKQAKKIEDLSATRQALARGEVSLAQAELIADKVKDLPGDPTEAQREGCETQLLDDAKKLSLKDLSRRADRVTETFAPDDVDAHENETLAQRETMARKNSYFWMADRKDGTYKGEFVIPEAQGEMLKNALEALNAPQVKKAEDDPTLAVLDGRPTYGQQLASAFCTLIEHLPADKLPDTAGVGVTVTVNIDLESLIDGLKGGTLSTGCRISVYEARRMACEHGLLPMVFNGKPLPLDCGREQRLFNRAQRRAAEKRDRGCSFPGCDRPPAWCVGHHARKHWAKGGATDLGDIVLICAHHHRVVHADDGGPPATGARSGGGWEIRFAADGYPEYIPPASIDPRRRPLRNPRFRAEASTSTAA